MIQLRPAHPSFRGGSPARWCHINKHKLMEQDRLAAEDRHTCALKGAIHIRYMIVHPHSSPPAADRIWHSHSFNVGTAGAKIFTGPAAEEFGYQVQQASNHEGKWYEITDHTGVISSVSLSAEMHDLEFCKLGREAGPGGSVVTLNECFILISEVKVHF